MSIFQALILGIIQGITEFLPISSSAHLSLFPFLFNWKQQSLEFDLIVHGATLLVIIICFKQKILDMLKGSLKKDKDSSRKSRGLILNLILTSIPAIIAALIFTDTIENLTREVAIIAVVLILVGIVLILADRYFKETEGKLIDLTPKSAVAIGLFQALALVRGISRSGITIIGSMFNGLSRKEAAEYTFLAGIPITAASMGKLILDIKDMGIQEDLSVIIVGFLSAFISGYIAVNFLMKFLSKHGLSLFGYYRIAFGIIILLILVLR